MLSSYRNSQNLKLTLNEFSAALRDTQKRAITQENGKQWGIRLTNDTSGIYQVWSGQSFASGTVDQTYALKRNISFGNPSAGSTIDIIFEALSGKLSEKKVITVYAGNSGADTGDLVLNTLGKTTVRTDKYFLSYWHFDEGTSTVAYDASGNGNSSILYNSPLWQSGSSCIAGGCLNLNGMSQYLNASSTNMTSVDSFTVAGWTYLTDVTTTNNTLYGNSGTVELLTKPTGYYFGVWVDGVEYSKQGTTSSNINSWVHWALTRSDSSIVVYRNGISIDSRNDLPAGSVDISGYIGAQGGTSYYLEGNLDELRVYGRALSAQEILDMYNDLK